MKHTYTYKQILLALREEYINVQKQLDYLRQYVESNKKIEDYRFRLDVNQNANEGKLFLEFELRNNLIEYITKIFNNSLHDNTFIFDITYGFKEKYSFNRSEVCDCYFKIKDEKKFNDEIQRLVHSDYMNEMIKNKDYILPINTEGEKYFGFNWRSGTRLVDAEDPYYSRLNYDVLNNLIYYYNLNGLSKEELNNMLKYSININNLNKYYKDIMNNYSGKDIVVDANLSGSETSLSIVETPKEYVLINKK